MIVVSIIIYAQRDWVILRKWNRHTDRQREREKRREQMAFISSAVRYQTDRFLIKSRVPLNQTSVCLVTTNTTVSTSTIKPEYEYVHWTITLHVTGNPCWEHSVYRLHSIEFVKQFPTNNNQTSISDLIIYHSNFKNEELYDTFTQALEAICTTKNVLFYLLI